MEEKSKYTKTINWKQFYRNVFALVIPIAIQNLINVGVTATDVIMLGKVGEKVLSGASLAGQIQYIMTLIFLRSDLRSNGSDGAVLGEERHQNDRESPGYGIKCRTHRCGSIRRSSPWHAGDIDADLYL